MSVAEADELMIGGVPATGLAARYATPLYVYDACAIRDTFVSIRDAVPYEPLRVHYACVTNANIAIMREILALGGGIHANTWGDAFMALQAGFAPANIVYSGSYIGHDDLRNLYTHGIAVNLNSLSQLRAYAAQLRAFEREGGPVPEAIRQVGLRIHLEDQLPYSRMGVQVSELDEARGIAAQAGLRIAGVHYYRGTGTSDTEHFLKPFPALLTVARRCGDTLRYVDVGGGFGHQYMPGAPTHFEWAAFGARFAEMMEELCMQVGRRVTLILEPGRSVVATAGFLLTRVAGVDRRAAGGQVAGVDTTTSHISSETYRVYGGYRRIVLANRSSDEPQIPTDVVGCTTFSDDYIGRAPRGAHGAEHGVMLPPLREGDLLAVLDAGGYGYAFASNFLNKPKPAEVMVDGGQHRLIRRREMYDDLLRLQVY